MHGSRWVGAPISLCGLCFDRNILPHNHTKVPVRFLSNLNQEEGILKGILTWVQLRIEDERSCEWRLSGLAAFSSGLEPPAHDPFARSGVLRDTIDELIAWIDSLGAIEEEVWLAAVFWPEAPLSDSLAPVAYHILYNCVVVDWLHSHPEALGGVHYRYFGHGGDDVRALDFGDWTRREPGDALGECVSYEEGR